ncbi:MAG: HEAT repeat domain-containing protein, partial [Deltaproteobacteria bacterium]|nr:HEAT repeat domain-containing protein [Deltaproteobacteria bacterium]
DEEIKWHAVSVMGILVAKSAETDLEGARDILRRMLWSLNEESGSIGWGMPEAMGEILVRTEKLAQEFAPILVSYIRPDGNLLEFELLQRGVLWGIGRLAEIQPQLMQSLRADRYLLPYLGSRDSSVRGLAAWVLGSIGGEESIPRLASLLQDEAEIKLYKDRKLKTARVHELANEALALIKRRGWA